MLVRLLLLRLLRLRLHRLHRHRLHRHRLLEFLEWVRVRGVLVGVVELV